MSHVVAMCPWRAAMRRSLLLAAWMAALACLASLPTNARAQTEPARQAPKVVKLTGALEVDDIVTVHVENLRDWTQGQERQAWKLVPFMDGRPLPNTFPISVHVGRGIVRYHLRVTDKNEEAWRNYLLSPPALSRTVTFSIGLAERDPFESVFDAENPASLIVLDPYWAIAAAVVLLVLIVSFIALALRTPILREWTPLGYGRFSLAKAQMSIWFFLIFTAFLMIWLATGRWDSLNGTTLALLGITAGTALGDMLLMKNVPVAPAADGAAEAPAETAPPAQASIALPPNPELIFARNARGIASSPKTFVRDLVSSDHGPCFHRFQMLAWTTALGMVFCSYVYYHLAMPEFRVDLLYLLGLSSGTYLGFRVPELQKAPPAARPVEEKA